MRGILRQSRADIGEECRIRVPCWTVELGQVLSLRPKTRTKFSKDTKFCSQGTIRRSSKVAARNNIRQDKGFRTRNRTTIRMSRTRIFYWWTVIVTKRITSRRQFRIRTNSWSCLNESNLHSRCQDLPLIRRSIIRWLPEFPDQNSPDLTVHW